MSVASVENFKTECSYMKLGQTEILFQNSVDNNSGQALHAAEDDLRGGAGSHPAVCDGGPAWAMWRTTPAWMWREKLQWSSEVS